MWSFYINYLFIKFIYIKSVILFFGLLSGYEMTYIDIFGHMAQILADEMPVLLEILICYGMTEQQDYK